jgi:hypothetical protein
MPRTIITTSLPNQTTSFLGQLTRLQRYILHATANLSVFTKLIEAGSLAVEGAYILYT